MMAREKSIPPRSGTRVPETLDRLIAFHNASNKPEEAAKWRAERARYPEAGEKT
jgi:hypothetical protein